MKSRQLKINERGGFMKKSSFIILILLSLSFSVLTCSDSEKRLSPLLNQTKVIIDLGLPPEHAANESTMWDKIRGFFIRDAVAQSAPATFSSILVRVSGPDIGVMEQSFGPMGTLSLNVPSGSFRQFEVIAYVAPGDPSAALSFSGAAIANLPAGDTVTVPVFMAVNETKIVIPDSYSNGLGVTRRLVQLDNMSNTFSSWKQLQRSGITGGLVEPFIQPWDVDFDSRGRIYVANNRGNASMGDNCVFRIDNINGGTPYLYPEASARTSLLNNYGITSVAVDRVNNYVYYSFFNSSSGRSELWRSNIYDNSSHEVLTINVGVEQMVRINGMSSDSNGMLYIAGQTTGLENRIFKYNTSTQIVIAAFGSGVSYLINPEDTLVKPPYVFVANPGGSNNYKILQLDMNLQFVTGYGIQATGVDTAQGHFYGPRRFLAIRNDSLIIVDDYTIGTDLDKLVSMNNMLGSGWNPIGSSGGGVGEFMFFYGC
jgi:hypothetical protein